MTQVARAQVDSNLGPASASVNFPRRFDMLRYFQGRVRGIGVFEDRFRTVRLRMAVDTLGQWQDDVFILSELFSYADGRTQTREWRIERAGEDRLRATASDVVGKAEGRIAENGIVWRYRMNVQLKRRRMVMAFNDRMYLEPDGVVININDAFKFGFRIGRLVLSFQRAD